MSLHALVLAVSVTSSPAEVLAQPEVAAVSARSDFPTYHVLFASSGAAVVSVPVGLFLGTLIGSGPNKLLVAALPALLSFALIPPVAVTLIAWHVANRVAAGSASVRPALWVTAGVHLAAMVAAILLNVSSYNLPSVAMLTAAEAVLLPVAATVTMRKSSPLVAGAPALALPALAFRF